MKYKTFLLVREGKIYLESFHILTKYFCAVFVQGLWLYVLSRSVSLDFLEPLEFVSTVRVRLSPANWLVCKLTGQFYWLVEK